MTAISFSTILGPAARRRRQLRSAGDLIVESPIAGLFQATPTDAPIQDTGFKLSALLIQLNGAINLATAAETRRGGRHIGERPVQGHCGLFYYVRNCRSSRNGERWRKLEQGDRFRWSSRLALPGLNLSTLRSRQGKPSRYPAFSTCPVRWAPGSRLTSIFHPQQTAP